MGFPVLHIGHTILKSQWPLSARPKHYDPIMQLPHSFHTMPHAVITTLIPHHAPCSYYHSHSTPCHCLLVITPCSYRTHSIPVCHTMPLPTCYNPCSYHTHSTPCHCLLVITPAVTTLIPHRAIAPCSYYHTHSTPCPMQLLPHSFHTMPHAVITTLIPHRAPLIPHHAIAYLQLPHSFHTSVPHHAIAYLL